MLQGGAQLRGWQQRCPEGSQGRRRHSTASTRDPRDNTVYGDAFTQPALPWGVACRVGWVCRPQRQIPMKLGQRKVKVWGCWVATSPLSSWTLSAWEQQSGDQDTARVVRVGLLRTGSKHWLRDLEPLAPA